MAALWQLLPCKPCGRRAKGDVVRPAPRTATEAAQEDMDQIDEDMDDPDMYMDEPGVHVETVSKKADEKLESRAKPDDKSAKAPKAEAVVAPKSETFAATDKPKWAANSKLAEQDGEVAMLKGNTFLLREEYDEALLAFEHALTLQPSLEEAHIGRVNALRKLHKFMKAFSACREGLAKVESKELERLRGVVQSEYQANKKREADQKKKQMEKARKFVDKKMEEEMKNGCPSQSGALQAAAKKTTVSNATDEEREAWKQEVLNIYRDLFNKPGNQPVSSAEAVRESTASYSSSDKLGLQISDGHRPMPRPEGIQLPEDYRKPVGILSLAQLSAYNCNNKRLLVSVYGDIFDVSDRPDKYGKDGPYHYFSGSDITWGLASGKDDADNVNKFYDVWKLPTPEERDKRLQCLCSWIGFYEKEYGQPIGRLEVFDRERHLPAPPNMDDCCVM